MSEITLSGHAQALIDAHSEASFAFGEVPHGDSKFHELFWAETDTRKALWEYVASLEADLEQARVQLAGCSVAALGYAKDGQDATFGDYGHSASFEDVKRLYAEKERLRMIVEGGNANKPPVDYFAAIMHEMGKHHKDSDAFKSLTRVIESVGGSVNVCTDDSISPPGGAR